MDENLKGLLICLSITLVSGMGLLVMKYLNSRDRNNWKEYENYMQGRDEKNKAM